MAITRYNKRNEPICARCACPLCDQREVSGSGEYVCEQCASDEDAESDEFGD